MHFEGARMNQPFVVNTLERAAEWLAEATGAMWSPESIVDIVFRLNDKKSTVI